jgi:hypothetical protein
VELLILTTLTEQKLLLIRLISLCVLKIKHSNLKVISILKDFHMLKLNYGNVRTLLIIVNASHNLI